MALDICRYKKLGTTCTTSSYHFRSGVNERFEFVFDKLCGILAQGTNTTSTTTTTSLSPTTTSTTTLPQAVGGFEILLIGEDEPDLLKHNTIQITDSNKISFVDNFSNIFTLDLLDTGGGGGPISASDISTGTLSDARLTTNVVLRDAVQTLTNKTLTSPTITNPIGLVKADVGLTNVNNTSDANKPVSTATQTALDLKLNITTAASTYEPIFAKNTAFNKNFGTTADTVAQGNDSRIINGQTAFGYGNHASAGYLLSSTAATTYQQILVSGNNIKTVNGQSLVGSGDITIAGGGGGSSPWTVTGNDIYYNTGNVGIGIATPRDRLHIQGDSGGIKFGGANGRTISCVTGVNDDPTFLDIIAHTTVYISNIQLQNKRFMFNDAADSKSTWIEYDNGQLGLDFKLNNTSVLFLGTNGVAKFTNGIKVGAYTLPTVDGTANQTLVTNGSGVVTWETPAGGGGGSMVYPSAGIPISNGTSWSTSIVNNSTNWNTAFGWGNHAVAGYQPTLVSGTNIKTINGTSILGSGNIIITGGGSAGTLQETTSLGNTTTDDIEITDATKGIILTAPNSTRWRVTVSNGGSLTTTQII